MNRATTEGFGRQTIRQSREALMQRAAEEPDLAWRVIGTLNAFRALIAIALLILFFARGEPRVFGDESPTVFWITAAAYLVFAIFAALTLRRRWVPVDIQAATQLLVDIVAIVILMHASGGISSGLGGLLIVFVGAGSLVLPIQYPTVLAAVATFAIATRPLGRRIQATEALARQRGVDLQNLSELNEYIVQHLRESIVVVDGDDRIRLSNASATRLLGTSPEVSGLPLRSVFEPLDDYLRKWRSDPSLSAHQEFTVITSGDNVRIEAHLAPLGKDGVRGGPVLVFLEDASLMNERVQQSKLASLGRLSASIAHEIRNPVGAMSHAAQLLRESSGLDEDDKRLTEIIESHSGRVSHIIDNVLQLSRRELSRPEILPLKPWLEDFAQEFTRTLELQEGELAIAPVPEELEARMDRSHLRQVLWNLCDNAVKYASLEAGAVAVELRCGLIESTGRPFLEIADRGAGIPDDIVEQVFEPFFTAQPGGTGLGLYISRELCERNGSALSYHPRPGGGSVFRIMFADPRRWQPQKESA